MFLLLILNECCSDGIIVEASDEFGYRVWFLVYRVWCFHPPSWTGSLPASCQCQHPARLCYQHLGFIPVGCCSSCLCGSFQVLVCCRDIIPSAEARCSLIVIAICSVLFGDDCWFATVIATVCRGSLMVDAEWNLMKVDDTSLVICQCVWILMWYPDFHPIANLSCRAVRYVIMSVSLCQFVGESVFTYIWNQMKFKDNLVLLFYLIVYLVL